MAQIIIDDENYRDHLEPVVGGDRVSRGLVPRDYAAQPHGTLYFAKPFDLPLVNEADIPAMIAEKQAKKTNLSDIRMTGMGGQMIPSRDQNGFGYCWCHGPTSAVLLARARDNQPYLDLSAFAIGCIIKNYRNQGGWGGDAVEFLAERGVPTSEFWPQKSTNRSNDNPKTWENAAKHEVQEWMDLDPSNMEIQIATCLLNNIPLTAGLDWWGHEVCYADLVGWNPIQVRFWNSWTDSYGDNGMGILKGRKAIPSAALGLRVIKASRT